MGKKSNEQLTLTKDELKDYLHQNHSIYMELNGKLYYLTDVNFQAWRVQDTDVLNEKDHYTDCSDLVPTVDEFMVVTLPEDTTLEEVVDEAVFYPSLPKEAE